LIFHFFELESRLRLTLQFLDGQNTRKWEYEKEAEVKLKELTQKNNALSKQIRYFTNKLLFSRQFI
jgi:hypothetical protein